MPQIPHARYADALASLARLGLVEFGRQSLVGGHYALLDADFQQIPASTLHCWWDEPPTWDVGFWESLI